MGPDDGVTLPVPESVVAFYLVPTAEPALDPRALLAAAAGQFQGVLDDLVRAALAAPNPPLSVRPLAALPPLPLELFAALGATDGQLNRLERATHFVTLSAASEPGWPSLHEWVTRALAVVAARELHSDVVDVLDQRVLDPATAQASLPDARGRVRLADWVTVSASPDRAGAWCTTTGLRRFGLPELQSLAVPADAVLSWGRAMTGIAGRLLAAWRATLITNEGAAFVQLPATFTVTATDVADAYAAVAGPRGPRSRPGLGPTPTVSVRVILDPAVDPDGADSFLTLLPPGEWPGTAGAHIIEAGRILTDPTSSIATHRQE